MNITYETAIKIKDFLGETPPMPIDGKCWETKYHSSAKRVVLIATRAIGTKIVPAYSLEDLLSKLFCEAIADKMGTTLPHKIVNDEPKDWGWDAVYDYISKANKYGGFPAVEKELLKLIGGI